MDARTGAITTLQHIQLPPITHPEQAVENRQKGDRPLPLEPFPSRESYVTSPSTIYQQPEQRPSQWPPATQSQQIQQLSPVSALSAQQEYKRDQEFDDHLRKSLANDSQSMGNGAAGSRAVNLRLPTTSQVAHSQEGRGTELVASSSYSDTAGIPALSIPNGISPPEMSERQYPPILPWTDDVEHSTGAGARILKMQILSPSQAHNGKSGKAQKVRRKWTDEETKDLLMGCSIYGVGNWKRVLDDSRFNFNNRSSIDLKDRFRTCFPREYKQHFGRDKRDNSTGKASDLATILVGEPGADFKQDPSNGKLKGRSRRGSNSPSSDVAERLGLPKSFPKAPRRERKPFSAEEDAALLRGFQVYGPLWSKIQADAGLDLSHRRSTDLRDRFRNAFPDKYTQAGFKAKPKHPPKPPRSCPSNIETLNSEASLCLTGCTSPLSVESCHQFEASTDVDGLEDFGLGPPSELHDHNSDDPSHKSDSEFNLTIMHEFLGDSPSIRDWNPDHDSNHHQDDNSLLPPTTQTDHDERNSPSPPTSVVASSMPPISVETTLTEDFSARIFDQSDLFQPSGGEKDPTNVDSHHHDFDKMDGEPDVDVGVGHDLVRWEDMVTHPIFTLDTGPSPAPGIGTVAVGMDGGVTLAPINPALFTGGSGVSSPGGEPGEAVVPGLSALLEELNSNHLSINGGVSVQVPVVVASSKRKQNTGRRKRREKGEGAGGEAKASKLGVVGGKRRRIMNK